MITLWLILTETPGHLIAATCAVSVGTVLVTGNVGGIDTRIVVLAVTGRLVMASDAPFLLTSSQGAVVGCHIGTGRPNIFDTDHGIVDTVIGAAR